MLAISKLTLFLLFCGWLVVAPAQAETARVKYVIDGDTVILEDNRHVRLLAINAPEVEGKRAAEPAGETAKRWLKRRIEDKVVRLVSDKQKRDIYGRWLFYLFDAQGELLNEELLDNGLAVLSVHPPNLRYLTRLQRAQRRAEMQKLGIWGLAHYRAFPLQHVIKERRQGWLRVLAKPNGFVRKGKYHRLLLDWNANIRISKANLDYFPNLKNYLSCPLEVRGWLSWRKGQASILVRHPSQLIIKDSNQCRETL